MSALFDFRSFCIVLLLTVCTCTYIKVRFPSVLNSRVGFRFVLSSACGKLAGGERVANGRCMAARVDCQRGEENERPLEARQETHRVRQDGPAHTRPTRASPQSQSPVSHGSRHCRGIWWKFARIGERLSPLISLACLGMAVSLLVY